MDQSKTMREWNDSPHKIPVYPHDDAFQGVVKEFNQWCIGLIEKEKESQVAALPLVLVRFIVVEAENCRNTKVDVNAWVKTSVPVNNNPRQRTLRSHPLSDRRPLFEKVINLTAYKAGQILRQQYAKLECDVLAKTQRDVLDSLATASSAIVTKLETKTTQAYSEDDWQTGYWNVEDDLWTRLRLETKRQRETILPRLKEMSDGLCQLRNPKPDSIGKAEDTASSIIKLALVEAETYQVYCEAEERVWKNIQQAFKAQLRREGLSVKRRKRTINVYYSYRKRWEKRWDKIRTDDIDSSFTPPVPPKREFPAYNYLSNK